MFSASDPELALEVSNLKARSLLLMDKTHGHELVVETFETLIK